MSRPAKKKTKAKKAASPKAKPKTTVSKIKNETPADDSKQARVISMLEAPDGTTIGNITKVTGWKENSVRGFLAGVVRKKLKLELTSQNKDGERIYRINRKQPSAAAAISSK